MGSAMKTGEVARAPETITPSNGALLRRCGGHPCSCDSDERALKESLFRSATSGGPVAAVPSIVGEVLDSQGSALDSSTASFMSSRFGHDFRSVQIHTDAKAATSARSVEARAYTVGNHVVFGADQFSPTTERGRELIAHELTHVVQQNGAGRPAALTIGAAGDSYEKEADRVARRVLDPSWEVDDRKEASSEVTRAPTGTAHLQRWSYGSGAAPHPDYVEVPAADLPRIERAMEIVTKVVMNPKDYPQCPPFFKNNCPGGTDKTLGDVFNKAQLWKDTDVNPDLLGSSTGADHIAYTTKSYGVGRWAVAASMFHELIHNCGQASHVVGDDAKAACGRLPNI